MLVAIDSTLKQRETKWVCVCPNCQHERIISYSQKWNIETNKSNKECRICQIELGLITLNTEGLKLTLESQDKAAKARTGIKRDKSKDIIKYRQLFAPETLSNEEMSKNQSLAKIGKYNELANNWRGGKTSERKILMNRIEYINLRKTVFEQDNYTCQICKTRGGNLEMDHIKEWCNYPELRFEITNCRTLCDKCHRTTDNYGTKALRKKHGL